MAVALIGFGWTLFDASGVSGSPVLLRGLISASLLIVATLILVARAFKWPLLYAAVREYVRRHLWGRTLTSETILVGGSSGGGLAVGMVAKAVQELYGRAPRVFVIDQDYYAGEFTPRTGTLLNRAAVNLRAAKVLYVTSYIGTGRSKEALRQFLGTEDLITFAFVVDDAVTDRDFTDYFLVQGRRSIVPWPK
jgi:hypothetical protein